jgi:hypothetical protein
MKPTAVDAAVIKVIGSMRGSLNRRKYFRVKIWGREAKEMCRVNPAEGGRGLGFTRRERGGDHGPRVKFGVCIDFF